MTLFTAFLTERRVFGISVILLTVITAFIIPEIKTSYPAIENITGLLLNLGLFLIAFGKEKYEDERIEKIKSHALKNTFYFFILMVMLMGVHSTKNYNLLPILAIIQIYYIILMRVCLYRDSLVVYLEDLNADERDEFFKNSRPKLTLSVLGWALIIGAILGTIGGALHLDRSLGPVMSLCGLHLGDTIRRHWIATSSKNEE